MSQGISCKDKTHKPHWVVTQRKSNASAFNGYRSTPSDYSAVRCLACSASWRTKSKFVDGLPDAPADWASRSTAILEKRGVEVTSEMVRDLGERAEAEEFTPAFLVPGMNPKDWQKKKQ
jgi:hypothetical protein